VAANKVPLIAIGIINHRRVPLEAAFVFLNFLHEHERLNVVDR